MTNLPEVRVAAIDDASGIARVLVDGWKSTYARILPAEFLASFRYETHEAGTRQHLQSLPASSAVFVSLADDCVVGVAHVKEADEGPVGFSAELEALYVLPSVQRQHVGSGLFLRAVQWAQGRGLLALFLWVLRDNPNRRFYERLGGCLLPDQRVDNFAGALVTSVAYGWRDLDAIRQTLETRIHRSGRPAQSINDR
jgi:GNAT superfamily N-acetyltransferase